MNVMKTTSATYVVLKSAIGYFDDDVKNEIIYGENICGAKRFRGSYASGDIQFIREKPSLTIKPLRTS